MRSKLAVAVLAVAAFVAAGQLDHRGPADQAPAACSAAIKAGIYTADLYSQCIDDYNQAGRP